MTRTKSGSFMLLAVNFAIVLVLISGLAVNVNAQSDVDLECTPNFGPMLC